MIINNDNSNYGDSCSVVPPPERRTTRRGASGAESPLHGHLGQDSGNKSPEDGSYNPAPNLRFWVKKYQYFQHKAHNKSNVSADDVPPS